MSDSGKSNRTRCADCRSFHDEDAAGVRECRARIAAERDAYREMLEYVRDGEWPNGLPMRLEDLQRKIGRVLAAYPHRTG
jgi:hypothetical protein